MRAICVPCQRHYRCEKNEVCVESGGQLWSTDKYKCPGCGHEMIPAPRPGQTPLADEHQHQFARVLETDPPEVIIS